MLKFQLNLRKPNNYAFFCPVSKMHLTVSNPLGFAEGVTPAILRGLKCNALLDVDNVVDVATGKLKTAKQGEKAKETSVQAPIVNEQSIETTADDAQVSTTEPSSTANKKRNKKSSYTETE